MSEPDKPGREEGARESISTGTRMKVFGTLLVASLITILVKRL